jgi:hypothetical protein
MRLSLVRILTLSLAIAAVAAPAAAARPADPPPVHKVRAAQGFPPRPIIDRNPMPVSTPAPPAGTRTAGGSTDWLVVGPAAGLALLAAAAFAGLGVVRLRRGHAAA